MLYVLIIWTITNTQMKHIVLFIIDYFMSKFNMESPHQCHDQRYDQEPHIQYIIWSLCCHRMNCEQGLKALYTRRKVLYIIETMLRLFVRMPTGVVPIGERFLGGCHGSREGE
jgi:uncharacterized Fe-S cluster-containing radical SAM superfamily enzyme